MAGRVNTHGTQLDIEFDQLVRWYSKDPVEEVAAVVATGALTAANAGLLAGDTSGGAITSTLPAALGNLGLTYIFKLVDATNDWTVARAGTDTIDGYPAIVLMAENQSFTLRSDGVSRWHIIGKVGA